MKKDYYAAYYALQPGETSGNKRLSGRQQLALRSMVDVARILGISK